MAMGVLHTPTERFAGLPDDEVPSHPDHPDAAANRRAWQVLTTLDVPLLTAFAEAT